MLLTILLARLGTPEAGLLDELCAVSTYHAHFNPPLKIQRAYLTDPFTSETDEIINLIRGDVSGIIFVLQPPDLRKHLLGGFFSRLGQEHPKINLSDVQAGILCSEKLKGIPSLAGVALREMKRLKMATFPPAFGANEGATLFTDIASALKQKAV